MLLWKRDLSTMCKVKLKNTWKKWGAHVWTARSSYDTVQESISDSMLSYKFSLVYECNPPPPVMKIDRWWWDCLRKKVALKDEEEEEGRLLRLAPFPIYPTKYSIIDLATFELVWGDKNIVERWIWNWTKIILFFQFFQAQHKLLDNHYEPMR